VSIQALKNWRERTDEARAPPILDIRGPDDFALTRPAVKAPSVWATASLGRS